MKLNNVNSMKIIFLLAIFFNMSFADEIEVKCNQIESFIADERFDLLDENCNHEMCVLYNKYSKELNKSGLANKNFFLEVKQYLKNLPNSNQFIQEDIQKLDDNISYVIKILNEFEINQDINKTKQLLKSNRFDPHKIDYDKLTKTSTCNDKNSNEVYKYTKNIFITRTKLADYSRSYVGALDTLFQELDEINGQWDTYRKNSINLYLWELLTFNEWLYTPSANGFNPPADYQYLFLHPTFAISYQDYRENKLNDTLLIDIIGFFDWKGENFIKKPYGISLSTAYDGNDWGYGINARVWNENISFAVMQNRKNKTYLVFSIDFANFIMDKKSQVVKFRDYLNNLE